MIAMKELLPTTGYIRGGCSPIGMKKNYPVYIHESCLSHDPIYISAGQRGIQIKNSSRGSYRVCFSGSRRPCRLILVHDIIRCGLIHRE